MILQIVSIHDRAADAYGRPIFTHSLGQAIRSFQDEVNRVHENNDVNKHPDDFDLYHLGHYDDNSGKLTSLDEPKQLAIGKQLATPK